MTTALLCIDTARNARKCFIAVFLLFATAMFLRAEPDQRLVQSYGKLPLAFEENRGQAPAGVSYLSRTQSGVVLLRPGSVAMDLAGGKTMTMRFGGRTAPTTPMGQQKLPGRTSYLVGKEADWVRGVSTYASIRYASVYPGIDAVFHGNQTRLEYDFVLRPGADPDQIRIAFDGVERLAVDANGDLQLSTPGGIMTQGKPKIWQSGPQGRREVAGRYVLSGAAEARFEVDRYDRNETLVIDPVIEYSTYFGSTRDDRAQAVAIDATGSAYIAGNTATAAVSWGFVSKLNPGGTAVVYTVYLGSGVCNATARGIAVDSGKNAIVTGYYTQQDLFGNCTDKKVLGAKINPAGDAFVYELVWGGGQDYGNAVAVDGAGNAYFTGLTNGGFPTTAGVISPGGSYGGDAFISKMSPTGALIYSTYLGGGQADEGRAIALDGSGNAYVAGSTASPDFPKTANAVQSTIPNPAAAGFVTKVNSSATQILYSTYLGGNSGESIFGIAVDGQGKLHVTGNTSSINFPTTANAWDRAGAADDVFYSKIDPLKAGTAALMYSTFLGGAGTDYGEAIALDTSGRVWITGRTASGSDFPKVQATQPVFGGNYDAFVAQIDPAQSGAASLLFSTFVGGGLYDEGAGVSVDPSGNIYVVGFTGSANFPVVAALQSQSAGGNEGFVVKIAAPASVALATVSITPTAISGGASATGTVTLSSAAGVGGVTIALSSSSTAAAVPASVLVLAGQNQATFTISTSTVAAPTNAIVTASYGGVVKTATLTVNPALTSLGLNPASMTGTVTLAAAAPAGGAVVTLVSSNTTAATVPASATVAAGATTATFAITIHAVTTATTVTITATYSGASKTATLVVNPPLAALTLNPATATGTVTLATAAPAGGAVVTLVSSNTTAATVPASATVAAGATTATFAITTHAVTTATTVTITATYSGASKAATLVVNPPLAALTLNAATATGTVTLAAAAPAGGAVVTLVSSNTTAATVPASVTVAAGATTATFAITTHPVTTATTVTITATYNGASKAATLVVNPPLASLTLNPATATGTVTLATGAPAGGAVVTLVSSNTTAATVPASVTVAAGAATATFAITTHPVTTATTVTITATYSGASKAATLVVNPPLASLTLNPASVMGGVGSTGTVTLFTPAPAGGAVVALTSGNINAATVPVSVTVAAGATTATFTVTSKVVTAATPVTITATYNGAAKPATLTVNPAATIAALALNPTAVTGGAGSTGTVTLTTAAPAGGAVVALTSGNINAATVPVSVTVAAGATTATFTVTSKVVTAATPVTITATYNGAAKPATLTVNPPATLFSVTFNPATFIFGSVATGTVRLTSAAPAGGAVVALSSSDWTNFYLPASVTVAAGATTAQFGVSTAIGKSTTTITASYNGVNKTALLTSVYPTVVALTCAPNPVIAGTTTICTVTMNGIMPGPTTVWISTDQPFLAPANGTVTVPAGANTVRFSITTLLVPDQIVAHISADALATATVTTPLTINLTNRGRKWVLNNVVFKDGGTASGYFTYDAATGTYLDVNIQVTPGPDPNNPLGRPGQNLYYYPWPNSDHPAFIDNWSTPSLLSIQHPITNGEWVLSWTTLQFNFAQALTNAGGTIPLITNPVVAYSTYCRDNLSLTCTPPPANISQESFSMPPNWTGASGFYYRVVISGTVTAQ